MGNQTILLLIATGKNTRIMSIYYQQKHISYNNGNVKKELGTRLVKSECSVGTEENIFALQALDSDYGTHLILDPSALLPEHLKNLILAGSLPSCIPSTYSYH